MQYPSRTAERGSRRGRPRERLMRIILDQLEIEIHCRNFEHVEDLAAVRLEGEVRATKFCRRTSKVAIDRVDEFLSRVGSI